MVLAFMTIGLCLFYVEITLSLVCLLYLFAKPLDIGQYHQKITQ